MKMTLQIQPDGERLFTTGTAYIGDGFLYGFVLRGKSKKNIEKSLKKMVRYNTVLNDLITDIKSHVCDNKKITIKDDRTRLVIGFKCFCGTKWGVPLAELKACCVHFPEYKKLFETDKSRIQLAESLS